MHVFWRLNVKRVDFMESTYVKLCLLKGCVKRHQWHHLRVFLTPTCAISAKIANLSLLPTKFYRVPFFQSFKYSAPSRSTEFRKEKTYMTVTWLQAVCSHVTTMKSSNIHTSPLKLINKSKQQPKWIADIRYDTAQHPKNWCLTAFWMLIYATSKLVPS